MVVEIIEFVAFTLLPGAALLVGIIYSLREIYHIGEKRIVIIVLILGFMLIHQFGELNYFLETSAFRDPSSGELPETSANLIAAGSVYYILRLLRDERTVRDEFQETRTELTAVKNRLETIFDNVNDGIMLVDLENNEILDANRAAHDLLRYEYGELEGMSPFDIHPHEPELFEELTSVLQPDGGVMTEKLSCRRGDGSTMPAAISATQTTVNDTDVLLVTIRDNSVREQYRTQLDLFTRVLRHNLRNDMTVVRGYLETIQTRVDDSRVEDLTEKGVQKCESLVDISEETRQLRDILRTEYRDFGAVVDLVPLVEDIVETYEQEFPHAAIETELPASAHVQASEDITWAIENLVENALVHAESDPQVHIAVSSDTIEEDGLRSEWVTVTVADKGPGIPDSEVTVLEDDANRTQTEHGTGLGLWVVHQLVEIFDGQLDITRSPESDYTTEVTLRLQPAENGATIEAHQQ